jgi:hypothetical protein
MSWHHTKHTPTCSYGVIVKSSVKLSVAVLNVILLCQYDEGQCVERCHAECYNSNCHLGESHYTKCHGIIMGTFQSCPYGVIVLKSIKLSVIVLSVIVLSVIVLRSIKLSLYLISFY